MASEKEIPVNRIFSKPVYYDGRITIPSFIRQEFNIEEGDTVVILVKGFHKKNDGKKTKTEQRNQSKKQKPIEDNT